MGGSANSEIPLLSSFLCLLGEAGYGSLAHSSRVFESIVGFGLIPRDPLRGHCRGGEFDWGGTSVK